MSLPSRFLKRIGYGEAQADTDQKGESLPLGVLSSNQAPAAYSTQHPNQWAKMRLLYAPIAPPTRCLYLSQRNHQGARGGDARHYDPHAGWERCKLPIWAQRRRERLSLSEG